MEDVVGTLTGVWSESRSCSQRSTQGSLRNLRFSPLINLVKSFSFWTSDFADTWHRNIVMNPQDNKRENSHHGAEPCRSCNRT